MSTSDALFDTSGSIAYLTFNRPAARNALTWPMYEALARACDAVDADPAVRVFVLRAAGDAFAAGTDIRQFAGFASSADGLAYERRLDALVDRLERVRVPTIAAVNGVAAGAGCILALACDLRVCTPTARFGMPIARTLGNCLSAANAARLADAFGSARAKDLVFSARFVDVREAEALGLVTRMAEPGALDDVTRDLAAALMRHAPRTLHAVKEAGRRLAAHRRLPPGAVDDLIEACYGSGDFREGIAAFLEKRPPRFTGA
ncbi:MAG: enoyl-CoA hydratase [Acidobacteriota bacterium]